MTTAENVVRIEAEALRRLADRIAGPMAEDFSRALELILCCAGRVVVTGMGKSGLIGRKLAATFASTGTPALYLHPAEALHGDLGMVMRGDLVLALSASGETAEILELLPTIKRLGVPLITLTGDCLCPPSARAEQQPCRVPGCKAPMGPRRWRRLPTSRSTARFTRRHVRSASPPRPPPPPCWPWETPWPSLSASAAASAPKTSPTFIPAANSASASPASRSSCTPAMPFRASLPSTPMIEVIYEMSRKGLGITAVTDADALIGIISDGDLRRLLEHRGKDVLDLTAGQCMTANPRTISADAFAAQALDLMEQKKITSLMVVGEGKQLQGVVHLHDLWGVELV